MAIFPNLEVEAVLAVDDRTRLDASKTFSSKDGPTIDKVEIEPESGSGFIEVTGTKSSDWWTDWQYDTAGTKVVTVRVNGDTTPVLATATIEVLTDADDALFAKDSDLIQEEPDVLKFVKKGRNSFKDVHREAQKEILDLLDRKGYRFTDGTKLTKDAVVDKSEVRTMGKYLALHLIFSGQSNQLDDIHRRKAAEYWSKYLTASERQVIGLDLDQDAVVSQGEGVVLRTAKLLRQ